MVVFQHFCLVMAKFISNELNPRCTVQQRLVLVLHGQAARDTAEWCSGLIEQTTRSSTTINLSRFVKKTSEHHCRASTLNEAQQVLAIRAECSDESQSQGRLACAYTLIDSPSNSHLSTFSTADQNAALSIDQMTLLFATAL